MAISKAAWGMEVGTYAIKAIRLEREGDAVRVSDFAVIPHKKVLTTPDLDQDEMVRLGLGQFISQKSLEGEHLVMSVPGHTAFARFAKLPPVEPKKVPDIVKFEAVQQIPFPIEEVEWDYQTFTSEDTPEIEVGIFAITRERVQQRLGIYSDVGITPESLTLSPVSVYNSMAYDQLADRAPGPIIYLDIGTQATDVIVAEGERCWIRTFPLGGTHFTEAIANAFKLSYSKAEKLKHEAATSKYAKQIMQAMRPVFSDLLQDLQRSIGYYSSLHGDAELTTMVGIGSTFKIPGLRKFIGQQLQLNVVRLDEYRRISVSGREAASFAEHTVNMATAYGLALQGVGLAPISANLVPVKALRDQMWHAKTKWFAAAAAIVVAGAAMTLYRPLTEGSRLQKGGAPTVVSQVIQQGSSLKSRYEEARATSDVGFTAKNMVRLTDYRNVWPNVVNDAAAALAAADPQPELLSDDPSDILGVDPKRRRFVELRRLSGQYIYAPEEKARRVLVTMDVQLSHDNPVQFLNQTVGQWLRDHVEPEGDREHVPYRIVPGSISMNPEAQEELLVDASGSVSTAGGRGAPPKQTGRRGSGFSGPAAPRQPAGGMSGGMSGGGGGGAGGAMGGGGASRRERPGGKRKAPGGPGGLGTGGPGGGATPPPTGGGNIRRPGNPPIGGNPVGGGQDRTPQMENIDALAPVPTPPSLFPDKSKLYRHPVTFEIELLDVEAPKGPARSAGVRVDGQEQGA